MMMSLIGVAHAYPAGFLTCRMQCDVQGVLFVCQDDILILASLFIILSFTSCRSVNLT